MRCWYSYPEQLSSCFLIDETSKNGLDCVRLYAWANRGEKTIVRTPFARGERVPILAACDVNGFVGWRASRGTFTRLDFHRAFVEAVLPQLNPWSLPWSIVVMDNACIHMYPEVDG
ncbi:hypothetical protein PC117_g12234 [Phytophthora cactorum]|uniref:Tc1-like transposase DDE domain-containing protein n=1 Tax=Phytophthora cactorum TaxID=29920 RepID=A0A8T1D8W2_9STRA|nr:hypothetical protein PC117_g12234 [Phytophthora cactorum]